MPDDILDRLTWQDFVDLTTYWKKNPPQHWLVEGFLKAQFGYGVPSEEDEKEKEVPFANSKPIEEGGVSPFRLLVDSMNAHTGQ